MDTKINTVIFIDKFNMLKKFPTEAFKVCGMPRVGDHIKWSYVPTPQVTSVVWDFEEGEIYIRLG